MVDTVTREKRSWMMSRVRSKNTKPEMVVRSLLHRLGYRFRLHAQDLPGKPDIVMRPRRKAIFVHGCFWHQHQGCGKSALPASRVSFWSEKLQSNVNRDQRNIQKLNELGWDVMVVWECQTRDISNLLCRLTKFID